MSANLKGIVAMCAAMAFFVINDTFVKLAAVEVATHHILLIRGCFGVALALAYLAYTGDYRRLGSLRHPLVLLRCAVESMVALCFISALASLSIADITAILLVSPLVITMISAVILREDVRWRRWAAVIIGFIGMVLVVRPEAGSFQGAAWLALASAIGVAIRDVITRAIPAAIPSSIVAAGTLFAATLTGGALSLAQPWTMPDTIPLFYLAAAALAVALGNLAIILAFRDTQISAVSPFRHTIILWAVISGFLVFGESPGALAWLGIMLIVASGLYTLYRESRLSP